MYTIMLVDDEIGVRNSIKAKIDWEAAGYRIISEAENGLEALRLLQEQPLPDLLISDIRMPQMDGLALIEACKESCPELKIIVLSGYSDFEYMKTAIRYGVKDYLLKPVVRGELTALLARLSKELEEDRAKTRQDRLDQLQSSKQLVTLQEQLIWQLVKDEWLSLSAVKERLRGLQLSALAADEVHARFAAIEMRIPRGRLDDWSERKDLLVLAFGMVCREIAEQWTEVIPLYDFHYPSMMYFLILREKDGAEEEIAAALVRQLQHSIHHYLRVETVVGIGEPVYGIERLKDAYASCMLSWSQGSAGAGPGERKPGAGQEFTLTTETERKLILSIESLDKKAVYKLLQDILPAGPDTTMFAFTFLTFRVILLFSSVARKFELGDSALQRHLWSCQMSLRDSHSKEQVLRQLEELAELVMEEVRKTRFSNGQQLVEAIRKYVDDNFSYELSLASLADMFHLNETYLSGLFKQAAGMTFSDYVTKLRMDKALALIKENQLKLTDIATLVGYSSSSYFSTVFKKYYGASPKEYRVEALGLR
ncbi:two-component system, response regulator YesN [Paenibacillus sp. UNCCL117]|uniref:response regulator n=1 Tax=unclassified Paenibacillus TaxID=185978 RepID=UPI00088CD2E8|nr:MULTISPECIES: response regulator [unclassified Paenibacillus]SDE19521.1 two-component system, response regulator YesN [Paenibacillus sp. cl123]SFW61991.1 two-component system, response regulator YesN [Paenibacillus sp. UNCCL117]